MSQPFLNFVSYRGNHPQPLGLDLRPDGACKCARDAQSQEGGGGVKAHVDSILLVPGLQILVACAIGLSPDWTP